MIETLPDEDRAKEYLKIIVRYVLIAGPLSTERVVQHTKRFPGGEEMVGTAAQEIEEKVKQEYERNKEKWVDEAKVERSQEMLIKAAQNKFGVVKPKLAKKIHSVQSIESLDSLFNQIFFVHDENEFKKLVDEVISED